MKKSLLLLAILLAGTALMGADNSNEALEYVADVGEKGKTTAVSLIGFGLLIIGWGTILGSAFGSYSIAYKKMKETDDQDRSGGASSSMTRVKAVGIGIIGAIGGSILLTLVFTKVIPVDKDAGRALQKVLMIDQVMRTNN